MVLKVPLKSIVIFSVLSFVIGLSVGMLVLYPLHFQAWLRENYGVSSVSELNKILSPYMRMQIREGYSLNELTFLFSQTVLAVLLISTRFWKNDKHRLSRKILLAVVFVGFLGGCFSGDRVNLVSAQTATYVVNPEGAFVKDFSYLIYSLNGNAYAVNGLYGTVPDKGTDAASVVRNVVEVLEDGKIFFKTGTYIFESYVSTGWGNSIAGVYITNKGSISIECEAGVKFIAGNATNLTPFWVDSVDFFKWVGGEIDANRDQQTWSGVFPYNQYALFIRNVKTSIVKDLLCKNALTDNLVITGDDSQPTKICIIENVYSENAQYDGLLLSDNGESSILYAYISDFFDTLSDSVSIELLNRVYVQASRIKSVNSKRGIAASNLYTSIDQLYINSTVAEAIMRGEGDVDVDLRINNFKIENTGDLSLRVNNPTGKGFIIHVSNGKIYNSRTWQLTEQTTLYMTNVHIVNAKGHALYVPSTGANSELYLSDVHIVNSTLDSFVISADNCYLHFDGGEVKNNNGWGVWAKDSTTGEIRNVIFSNNPNGHIYAPNVVKKYNIGFLTENSGNATILAGNTYVDVAHGLSITPDINKFDITPKDNLAGRSWWISNVNATHFRINLSSSDTVNHSFGWSYED